MAKKKADCEYGGCKIPKTNNKYLCQVGYMSMGVVGLMVSRKQFTALAVLLFVVPVLFDFIFNLNDIEFSWYKKICWAGIIVNGFVALFCFGVLSGAITDNGDVFVNTSTSMLPDMKITKDFVLWFCIADLFGPILFWQGCTSQETLKKSISVREACEQT